MNILLIPGHWNSGTTLLVDIMRQHPSIRLRHARYKPNLEDRIFVKIMRRLGLKMIQFDPFYERTIEQGWDHYQQPQPEATKLARFRRIFGRKHRVRAKQWLLFKNPWLLFLPDFLIQLFVRDQVKYVIILRDGIHQVVSKDYWKRDTDEPERKLIARAHFWVRCMEYYLDHWQGRPDVLTLRYETLCQQPAEQISAICDFVGLDATPLVVQLPTHYTLRTTNWDRLDPALQKQVQEIVAPMQAQLDPLFSPT